MPDDHNPAPPLAPASIGAALLEEARQAGLLGERVRPEAIAAAVLYLNGAEHVTGQIIAVDSGQHLGWRTPDVMATMRGT